MNITRHRIRKQGGFAVADEMYAKKITKSTSDNYIIDMRKSDQKYVDEVFELAGLPRDDPHGVQDFRFLYSNSDGSDVIHESWAQAYNYVVIDGTRYTLKSDGTWSTREESSPRP